MPALGNKFDLTPKQKEALKEAEVVFKGLVKKYGFDTARWAINRKLRKEAEKKKLIAEKIKVEKRLNEIKGELD